MDFEVYEDPIEYTVTEDKIFCDYGDLDYDVDGDTATVQAISVYRTGQGIGRKLVELFEDSILKENVECVLVPATPSKEAISFWKKMNYKPSGQDDKYWARKIINSWKESTWDTPQGVIVMEKSFKGKSKITHNNLKK
jgi:ribosomal protein S18 acetylase RimI-like enzyme